jgi:hypothetical protein
MTSKGRYFMKSKFGFLSAAFVAASVLFGSGDASAGGGSQWWGRGGYGPPRIKELHACIDDYTAELRVAFKSPGANGLRRGLPFVVAAELWGDALCTDLVPGPVPLPGPGDWHDADWCPESGYPIPYGPGPADIGIPEIPVTRPVYMDGLATYDEPAWQDRGNWFYANFDLFPLTAALCGPGLVEEVFIDRLTIVIDGVPFFLGYEPPPCGVDWYLGL